MYAYFQNMQDLKKDYDFKIIGVTYLHKFYPKAQHLIKNQNQLLNI